MSETHRRELWSHLFPGDQDEHGAVLLVGVARHGADQQLLVREVVPALDGEDYLPGTRGYRHLTGEFMTHQLRRAKDLGVGCLAVHNHGGTSSVGFSSPDLQSHERSYPTWLGLLNHPVGGVVCATGALAGDVWWPDGTRTEINQTVVVGDRRQVLTPLPVVDSSGIDARYSRQSLLFGQEGQEVLAGLHVAIVGAGGVGMILVELLARLGVGQITVIDPDRVSPSNLSRLPGASRHDALETIDQAGVPQVLRRVARHFARPKVQVAKRIARRANPSVTCHAVQGDVADDSIARRIVDSDFIFLAADTMLARDVVNQIAYQYLIPTLQVGSKVVVDKNSGDVTDVFSAVRHVGFGPGCLTCSGLIDPARLNEEALGNEEQAMRQRYVGDPLVVAPSVITLNALGCGFAANDFMQWSVGLGASTPAHRLLRNRPAGASGHHVTTVEPEPDEQCRVCAASDFSVRALGDATDLPTRSR